MSTNNNIFSNAFGFNVKIPTRTLKQVKDTAINEISNTVNPFLDYFASNDKVFTGEVSKEINKYYGMIYSLGQVMREGQPTRTFDITV